MYSSLQWLAAHIQQYGGVDNDWLEVDSDVVVLGPYTVDPPLPAARQAEDYLSNRDGLKTEADDTDELQ